MNERGFIFLELAIGLPLLLMLMWSMAHLFVGTWKICRDIIADFTMQIEVNEAMQWIVSDLKNAETVGATDGRTEIISYLYRTSNGTVFISKRNDSNRDRRPIYYFLSETTKDGKTYKAIYRQRTAGEKDHPLTGGDLLSEVDIKYFKHEKADQNLLNIEIVAESLISRHQFRLKTKVYVEEIKE